MGNIATVYSSATNSLDYAISNGQLLTDKNLGSLFLIALFTSNVQAGGFTRWWGSSYTPYSVGSRLPLLLRGVKSDKGSILNQARDYAKEALMPFQTAGLILGLSVQTSWLIGNAANIVQIKVSFLIPGTPTPQLASYGLSTTNGVIFEMT